MDSSEVQCHESCSLAHYDGNESRPGRVKLVTLTGKTAAIGPRLLKCVSSGIPPDWGGISIPAARALSADHFDNTESGDYMAGSLSYWRT
jgi:hypothetical protein